MREKKSLKRFAFHFADRRQPIGYRKPDQQADRGEGMASGLCFKWAQASDFHSVLDLASQLARHIESEAPPLSFAQFERFYVDAHAPMRLLLALRDERVVGLISWTLTHELYSADARVYISDVSVDRASRGRGVGAALMAQVKAWARAHGASKLGWEVWHRNLGAKRFYEKLGASIDEEAIPYILTLTDEVSCRTI